MSTSFFRPVTLSFNGTRIGYGKGLLHPVQAVNFLRFLHRHIRPEFGYIYKSMPDIKDILESGFSDGDPNLGPLKIGLDNLKKWLDPSTPGDTTTTAYPKTEGECPLCAFTTSLPEPSGHTQAALRANSSESVAHVVSPILRFSKRIAFIDPYILRLPQKPNIKPQDTPTKGKPPRSPEQIVANKIKTIVELIEASPQGALFAILSTTHEPKRGSAPGSKENPDAYMSPVELLKELEKHIPENAWVIVWNIEEKNGGPRFHGRYIHTVDFTMGIEGGLNNENKDERTDIYFLNQKANKLIFHEYISQRKANFSTLDAWLKEKGSKKFMGVDIKKYESYPSLPI